MKLHTEELNQIYQCTGMPKSSTSLDNLVFGEVPFRFVMMKICNDIIATINNFKNYRY